MGHRPLPKDARSSTHPVVSSNDELLDRRRPLELDQLRLVLVSAGSTLPKSSAGVGSAKLRGRVDGDAGVESVPLRTVHVDAEWNVLAVFVGLEKRERLEASEPSARACRSSVRLKRPATLRLGMSVFCAVKTTCNSQARPMSSNDDSHRM